MVLVHSREVNLPLNKNQSPFNVGLPIELPEFNEAQVSELVRQHGLNWNAAEIKQLMDLVGGHPYLLEVALTQIAQNYISLTQLLQTASTGDGLYSDYLWQSWLNLQQKPKLLKALEKLIINRSARLEEFDSELISELHHLGLVKLDNGNVKLRSLLYRQYFQERLNIS